MTVTTAPDRHPHGPLENPGRVGGLMDVFRRRYLLKLLVRKELRVRYQGSALGLAWSYVKPAVRFAITGDPRSVPTNHVVPMWDIAAGLNIALAVLAADRRRRETGEGQYIRLALSDVAEEYEGAMRTFPVR